MDKPSGLEEQLLGLRTSNSNILQSQNLAQNVGNSNQLPSNFTIEDRSGKLDQKEKKRFHDRMNQRLSRSRKKTRQQQREVGFQALRSLANPSANRPRVDEMNNALSHSNSQPMRPTRRPKTIDMETFTACKPDSEQTENFIVDYLAWIHKEHLKGSPHADTLLSLVQFNMTRALVANANILGITTRLMSRQARSRFAHSGVETETIDSLPFSLRPTIFQITIPHHPWIDLIPMPELRNRLLHLDVNSYDAAELCRDMRGFQRVIDGRGGITVWGEPWDPNGWEVSPAFAQKWSRLIRNCDCLLKSTNHWRGIRGEPALQFGDDELVSHNTLTRLQALD